MPGRGEATPKHPGSSGVCAWSFSSRTSLAGEVELYWHFHEVKKKFQSDSSGSAQYIIWQF